MATHDIATGLGTLHVQITGTGAPMLLLPSLLTDHTLYAAQVAYFSDRYTTIAVDPPGQGASEPLRRTFAFEESAQAYVDVLDGLALPWAHLVGNSWGAMIGGTIAATYPDRVGCAVLLNGTASAGPWWDRLQLALAAHMTRLAGRPLFVRSTVVPRFLGATTRRQRPELVDGLVAMIERNNARSASFAVESIVVRRPDQHALFGRITAPALVVAGREDASFPVVEVRRMAEAIRGSELVVLDQIGHLAAYEAPDTVNTLIDDFLNRHGN
ncbi:MAG: alpha/beta hydrolase [Mycobacterium sp.]|nr:alpha/beta hydrolase [Mycobacterium sp.]